MPGEFIACPFERRIVGYHGAILLRSNHDHAKLAATAIRRRSHPAWSRLSDDIRVELAKAAA